MVTSTQRPDGNSGNQAPLDPEAMKQQAGDAAQNLKDQAQQTAGMAADQVKQSAMTQVGSQKDRVTGSLNGFADTLHKAGEQLESSDQSGFFAKYVQQAADRVEQVANHLDEREINELLADVETYARQQPAIFLGGAFVLGVLGARFLKSSGQRTSETNTGSASAMAEMPNPYRAPVMSGTRDTATGVSRTPPPPSAMPTPPTPPMPPRATGGKDMNAMPSTPGAPTTPHMPKAPTAPTAAGNTPPQPAMRVPSPSSATGSVTPRNEDAERLDALRRGDVPHQMAAKESTTPNPLSGQSARTGTGDTARNTETT